MSVTVPTSLGGSGNTYTPDADPETGLYNGGHRDRFLPALADAVAMTQTAVEKAGEAANSEQSAAASASTTAANATQTQADVATTSAHKAAAANSASAASSSATSANNSLLALGNVLANGVGAFSVNADGELIAQWNDPTVSNIEINADGDLIVTYPSS